jgi:hypothetical protein
MLAMIIFIAIAALGLFHVISAQVTGVCFVAWLVVLVIYSQVSIDLDKPIEPDILVPPRGLGGYVADSEYVSPPPQGGDATIPVESRSDSGYTTKDVVDALLYIGQALARQERASDDSYDEPVATYPPMEQRL